MLATWHFLANPLPCLSLPSLVQRNDLNIERRLRGILLVLGLQSANPANHTLLKRQIVLGLRLFVDILNDNIDRFPGVALLQVDVSDQVGVAEVLWWVEGREDVLRAVGEVGVGGRKGQEASDGGVY